VRKGFADAEPLARLLSAPMPVSRPAVAAPGALHAVLWQDERIDDLIEIVDGTTGAVLETALAINDKGLLAAAGTIDSAAHTFLLKPVAA